MSDEAMALICDEELTHLLAQLEMVQPEVLAEEGRYLQMCPQPPELPAQGATGKT